MSATSERISEYTRAYSPVLEEWVSILKVRQDDHGFYILDCETEITHYPMMFRTSELKYYE